MNRERLIGFAVILLIIGGFLFLRNRNANKLDNNTTQETVSTEEPVSDFAKQMGISIPEDVEKTRLQDVTGGSSTGLATRKFVNGNFTHSVLAAVPDPEPGSWYEGWLVRKDPFSLIYTGKLRSAKGGWVLDFNSTQDLSDHSQVVITLEKIADQQPEAHVLEGDF